MCGIRDKGEGKPLCKIEKLKAGGKLDREFDPISELASPHTSLVSRS